jgi:tetratricopeptide (TPR) repeat protein
MKREVFVRSSALLVTALLGSTIALPAHAEDPTPARALFKEGRELASQGNYQDACPKFEQSLALEVGLGTQFNLADCWEHIGRNASAQQLFLGAAASAKAVGQADREQVLRERAAALEPRIVKLVIEVDSTDPRLTVKRDDLPLETAQYGRAVAIDPGSYTITAKSPGKKTWTKKVEVKPGQKVVTVSVPELDAEEAKPATLPAKAAPAKAEPVKAVITPPPSNTVDRDLNYPALGLAVFGATALTFGTYMGIRYKSANDDAKAVCPSGTGCTQGDISRHDDLVEKAKFNRAFSFVGFGAGIAAVTGSVLMFALEKPKKSTSGSVHAAPAVAAGYYGAALSGSF